MNKRILIPLTLLFVGAFLLAPKAVAQDIPSVYLYVNDLTSPPTLLRSEADDITYICYQVDNLTSAEVAVLIVNSTQPLGISQFAVKTFQSNGIGKAGRDNGVLIVVSTNERQWRIEVGYGLEGVLNDAKVGSIGRSTIEPAFASGDLYGGIYNATVQVGQEIVDHYDGQGKNPSLFTWNWKGIAITIAIFLLTGGSVISVRGIYRRSGYGGGRSGGGGAEGSYNFMRRPVRRRNFQGLRPRQHRSTTHRSVTTID